ncbi:glycerol-3-phosphate acyltransferase [Chloroflexota bacterium]
MNNPILYISIAILAAYLIGSFPAAYVAGRTLKGLDIREVGSRNMGAMNIFYQVGFSAGVLVLAVDIGKGAAAVALARWLGGPMLVELLAGASVIIGHSFPVFLKFHGGKGGATCIGVLAFLMPWGIPFYIAVFGLGFLLLHYPTLSYSIAFLSFPFIAWLKYHSWEFIVFSLAILLLPMIRYIPRLREMRAKGGSWRHVLLRRNLKDRL